ncbi:MAG: nucleotidyltransferase domain-containing protein [Chitinispirillales bacterium]|jgi:predicted nucleotidyltransferase|nr:nucleotidyltransferase domain-containing protein [Chitinispirillales bacterium]
MDEKKDIISIAKKYLETVKASDFPMQIEKAYLFGSFAKRNPNKDSDIDIALVVNHWAGNYLDVVMSVWGLRDDLDIRIEPHIVVPEEDYAGFLTEIQRTGIELI